MSKFVEEHGDFKVDAYVKVLIGPHKGEVGKLCTIELDGGARNGWMTVDINNKIRAMYAGEELEPVLVKEMK